MRSPTSAPPTRVDKRRRKRWPFVLALVLVLAAGGIFVGVRYDQYQRQKETAEMLDLIEESENAMYEWMSGMEELVADGEAACAVSQERCDEFWGDPYLESAIRDSAREAATSLRTIAGEFTKSRGLRILSWHKDVVLARDSYLDHNAAWVRHLDAISRNPLTELIGDTANDDDIAPTWTIACRNLGRLESSSMYPNLSQKNKDRVEKICKDS